MSRPSSWKRLVVVELGGFELFDRPVIAQQVEEAMLGYRVTLDTTAAEQESDTKSAHIVPFRRDVLVERLYKVAGFPKRGYTTRIWYEPVRRLLKFERKVRDQIEKLREQLSETRRNLRLTPDNIESVVRIGLELAQQPQLIPAEVPGLEGKAFHLPRKHPERTASHSSGAVGTV